MSAERSDIIDVEPVDEVTVANLPARYEGALIQPAASVDDIAAAFRAYQELRTKLLDPERDFQEIWGGSSFVKRSGWRKLTTAFGVSMEIVEQKEERDERGMIVLARCTVRATAPNGRVMDGWGACDVYERCCEPGCPKRGHHQHCAGKDGWHAHVDAWTHFSKVEHDVPATAETRAKNRAAADLFGMGELSAEELDSNQQDRSAPPVVCKVCGEELADLPAARQHAIDQHGYVRDAEGYIAPPPKSAEGKEADPASENAGASPAVGRADGGATAPPEAVPAGFDRRKKERHLFALLRDIGVDESERHPWASGVLEKVVLSFTELEDAEVVTLVDQAKAEKRAKGPRGR